MEYFTLVRWINLGCAVLCFWNYALHGYLITMCIGCLNLAVFIFGKELIQYWNNQ